MAKIAVRQTDLYKIADLLHRSASCLDTADERIAELAVVLDAKLPRQCGFIEHGDGQHVFRPDHIVQTVAIRVRGLSGRNS